MANSQASPLTPPADRGPVLLAGGNPQIARGLGDAPVQAWIAVLPGWKRTLCQSLDRLVVDSVPGAQKAVKWNSPLYGVEEGRWFLGLHCFAGYVKLAFFQGAALTPMPPGISKQPKMRYLDIREAEGFDPAQLADWFRQAARLPGERM